MHFSHFVFAVILGLATGATLTYWHFTGGIRAHFIARLKFFFLALSYLVSGLISPRTTHHTWKQFYMRKQM